MVRALKAPRLEKVCPDYFNDGDAVVKAADAAAGKLCSIFKKLIESL